MKKLFFIAFICIPMLANAQKEIYQGLFLYQFSKYIKWPDSYLSSSTGEFIIGVIGGETTFASIDNMAKTKKQTQGLDIVVVNYTNINQIDTPHILFIDAENSDKLNMVVKKVGSLPVLIVTEAPGLATMGSIINFTELEGKMRFELNMNKAEAAGLKISSSLSSLSIII